jgi:hypothetical protein
MLLVRKSDKNKISTFKILIRAYSQSFDTFENIKFDDLKQVYFNLKF